VIIGGHKILLWPASIYIVTGIAMFGPEIPGGGAGWFPACRLFLQAFANDFVNHSAGLPRELLPI